MNKLKITPLDFEKDIAAIKKWEIQFADSSEFNSIKKFILEDKTDHGLEQVIVNNYENYPIGDDEKKFCFSIKDNDNVAGFIIASMYNISIEKPELFLQYLVLNPDYQHCGFGTQVMIDLILNSKQYFGHKPTRIHSYIDINNTASLSLCQKFGFDFISRTDKIVEARKNIKVLESQRI